MRAVWWNGPHPAASAGQNPPTSVTQLSQLVSLSSSPSKTRVTAFWSASWNWKYFGPLNVATSMASARSVRISPVGALLKYSFVAAASSELARASVWLGKVPAFANALSWVYGEVSHEASCWAASTLAPFAGTTR